MGKGDRKSAKGKIWRGTHGKRRPKKSAKDNLQVLPPLKPKKIIKEVREEVNTVKPKAKTRKKTSKEGDLA